MSGSSEKGRSVPVAVVVEDEWLVRFEIADLLMGAGWHVVEFATGEAALEMSDSGQNVDLLITDIRLPGAVNGWDVAERFRAANSEAVVIYCSATPPDPQRQVPGSRFFSKPCRVQDLLDAVSRLTSGEAA